MALIEIRAARSAEVGGAAGGGPPTAAQEAMEARPLPVIPRAPECERGGSRGNASDERRHEQLVRLPPPPTRKTLLVHRRAER